jgi:hypothetical protein
VHLVNPARAVGKGSEEWQPCSPGTSPVHNTVAEPIAVFPRPAYTVATHAARVQARAATPDGKIIWDAEGPIW